MSKRKSARLIAAQAKLRKVDDQQNAVAFADGTIEEVTTPPIFQLVDDCCYAIFDFLSHKDLCSFGQTCKWAQEVAAEFYKENHSAIELFNCTDVFYLKNAQYLNIRGWCLEPYRQIKIHSNRPIKQIYLSNTTILVEKVNCLKNISRNVEHVKISNCKIDGDFYEEFLKFCENMKDLRVKTLHRDLILIGADNSWLTRKYPTLERLGVFSNYILHPLDELKVFFVENPNVRFACNYDHRIEDLFRGTKTQLDELAVVSRKLIQNNYLNTLHEQGVFQRLQIFIWRPKIIFMNGLEKLKVFEWHANECVHILPLLVNIKELSISCIINGSNMETVARDLVNLERVHLYSVKCEEFLSFIRHSAKLTKIKVNLWCWETYKNVKFLKLAVWNKEREKLVGARKVTLYIAEDVYLAKKWATHNIDLSLIVLKRAHSRLGLDY